MRVAHAASSALRRAPCTIECKLLASPQFLLRCTYSAAGSERDAGVRALEAAMRVAHAEIAKHAGGATRVASPPRIVDERSPDGCDAAGELQLAERLAMLETTLAPASGAAE